MEQTSARRCSAAAAGRAVAARHVAVEQPTLKCATWVVLERTALAGRICGSFGGGARLCSTANLAPKAGWS